MYDPSERPIEELVVYIDASRTALGYSLCCSRISEGDQRAQEVGSDERRILKEGGEEILSACKDHFTGEANPLIRIKADSLALYMICEHHANLPPSQQIQGLSSITDLGKILTEADIPERFDGNAKNLAQLFRAWSDEAKELHHHGPYEEVERYDANNILERRTH